MIELGRHSIQNIFHKLRKFINFHKEVAFLKKYFDYPKHGRNEAYSKVF
jgi:hypothetical protein